MTAITMGNTAQNPLAFLPHIPLAPALPKPKAPDHLHYQQTDTGLIAYLGTTPVAWLYPGYHSGQIDGNRRTVRFVDVAYHRQTAHGINLETADFQTLDEASAFIAATFGKGVAV